MIKLICDLNISLRGHNAGHVQYIIDNVKEKEGDLIYFLFNKQASSILDITRSNVAFHKFYFADTDFASDSLLQKLKFSEWNLIKHYAEKLNVHEVFIMELTRYEFQIGMDIIPFKISGIEFRPSHRIRIKDGNLSNKLSATIQRYKRMFFESLLLRSSSIHHIFILNDPEGVINLNNTYNTQSFKYTVDPTFDYPQPDKAILQHLRIINKKKVVFTIFGSLDWRKNIKKIFEAFTLISKHLHENLVLMVIGKIPKYFAEEFQKLVHKFVSQNQNIELIIIDEFVSDSLMEYYYKNTDVSLVIYPKFYGSSALLGRAAKYNAISLTPNVGLMAELCVKYSLGYICDPNSPTDIMSKILLAYQDISTGKRIDGARYYKEHSPEHFLRLLDF